MVDALAFVLGTFMIVGALADLVNSLVSTSTSPARWWPSNLLGRALFVALRSIARRLSDERWVRERMLAAFGPLLVLTLLANWVALQISGFALIWWSMDAMPSVSGPDDAWYYSGVVYFTVGFGEIVPTGVVPRVGALVEAFFGVITVALVIGYLPSLYAAYSDRERQLITLDAGGTERITPTALIMAWAPDADPKKIDAQFERWEHWAASILETHSTFPLLALFRSHDRRQNWVTALGLLCDAAIHAQVIMGATDGNAFWFLRRAKAIFREVTHGKDLTSYQRAYRENRRPELFRNVYTEMVAHGFDLRPYEDAAAYSRSARETFSPALEYLIDDLLCPRGFWPLHSTVQSWSSQHEIARYRD